MGRKNLFSLFELVSNGNGNGNGYSAKMYLLHHQVDLPNYNTLPPSVIPFWKAIDQANGIV